MVEPLLLVHVPKHIASMIYDYHPTILCEQCNSLFPKSLQQCLKCRIETSKQNKTPNRITDCLFTVSFLLDERVHFLLSCEPDLPIQMNGTGNCFSVSIVYQHGKAAEIVFRAIS